MRGLIPSLGSWLAECLFSDQPETPLLSPMLTSLERAPIQRRTALEALLALLGELLELLLLRRELGLVRLCGALLVLILGHGPRIPRNLAPAEPTSQKHRSRNRHGTLVAWRRPTDRAFSCRQPAAGGGSERPSGTPGFYQSGARGDHVIPSEVNLILRGDIGHKVLNTSSKIMAGVMGVTLIFLCWALQSVMVVQSVGMLGLAVCGRWWWAKRR